jgi:hypothetical protein
MTRTIVIAAPAKQLSKLVGHPHRRWIYGHHQPVWEDHDIERVIAAKSRHDVDEVKRAEDDPE